MKNRIFVTAVFAAALLVGCSKSGENQEQAQGEPIYTSVVGKDTSPISTRKGIEQSDEQKLTLPGRDTTNSEEPKDKRK